MKGFSIIFFNNPYCVARQYTLSYKIVYVCGFLLLGTMISLGILYYFQHQQIIAQQQRLDEQEIVRAKLQKEIDSFAEKEKRIAYLESYMDELKRSAYRSETALKMHLAKYQTSISKLAGLHSYVCQMMAMTCLDKIEEPKKALAWMEADRVIDWMEKIGTNFETLAQTITEFNEKKITVEDQRKTIQQMRQRIAKTENQLEKHLELLVDKEKAIEQLSKRIHKVTGIAINLSQQYIPKAKAIKTEGRGGPSVKNFSEESDYSEASYLQRYLQVTTQYYENVVRSIESLSKSIERDNQLWKNTPTIRPVKRYSISDGFGRRIHPVTKEPDFHQGLDFTAKRGTRIYAPADGVVAKAGRWSGYGKLIEIDHGLGFYKNKRKKVYSKTRYGHLHRIKVKPGQKVKRGDLIGTVGSTGISTGPHLHYEIIINGRHVNPLGLIRHFESHLKKRPR